MRKYLDDLTLYNDNIYIEKLINKQKYTLSCLGCSRCDYRPISSSDFPILIAHFLPVTSKIYGQGFLPPEPSTTDALHGLCRNDHAMICGVKPSDVPSMADPHEKLGLGDLIVHVRRL